MSQQTSIDELEDQLRGCQQRYEEINGQIRELLTTDVTTFVQREIRRAFVERSEVTQGMSDEQVKVLKDAAAALASRESTRVAAALALPDVWDHEMDPPEEGWSLEGVDAIWAPLQGVGVTVHDFLVAHDLESVGLPTYQAPRYFVAGMYLPTLAEHHWRLRRERSALLAQGVSLRDGKDRAALGDRWDSA